MQSLISSPRATILNLIFLHLYPGAIILAAYVVLAPIMISYHFPGLAALLLAELFILAPLELGHIANWNVRGIKEKLKKEIGFTWRPAWWKLTLWSLLGLLVCAIVYAPMFVAGLWLKNEIFSWLPGWFLEPGFEASARTALIITFNLGIVIDGFIGPIVEEIYFRGYLLPRMQWLGNLAPIINAILFTLYHFWQPHNYAAILMVSLVLSYAAWWKKSIWLSACIHCLMNILGSTTGLFAAIGGVVPY
jgi:uncharacterized protein